MYAKAAGERTLTATVVARPAYPPYPLLGFPFRTLMAAFLMGASGMHKRRGPLSHPDQSFPDQGFY